MDVYWSPRDILQGKRLDRGHNWEIFVLVYFMFQGIWIILGGIYLLVKINNFGGMGRPPPLVENSTKFIYIFI